VQRGKEGVEDCLEILVANGRKVNESYAAVGGLRVTLPAIDS
jgi:hypothetical protein